MKTLLKIIKGKPNLTIAFVAIALALIMAFVGIKDIYMALALCLGLMYIFLVLNRPLIHFYLFILTSIYFFGCINPEEFIRMPGAFKFTDIMFVLTILICALKKGGIVKTASYSKGVLQQYHLKRIIWLVISLAAFQILFTSFKFNLPIISCFKVGRSYLYFFTAIFAMKFFNNKTDEIRILKFIFTVAVIQSALVFLQNIFGNLAIFQYTKIIAQEIGEGEVTRVYAPASYYIIASFSLSLWMLFFKDKTLPKSVLLFVLAITLPAILLSYNRTFWICTTLIVIMPSVLIKGTRLIKYGFSIACAMIIAFAIIAFFQNNRAISFFITRAGTISQEVTTYSGNFAVRFEENKRRLELINEYPILGPGFVHADYAATLFNFKTTDPRERAALLQTNDSGMITWLVSFGALGVVWVVYLLGYLFRLTQKTIAMKHIKSGIIIGLTAYVWAAWLTSITTTGFTYTRGVVAFSVFVYLLFSTINRTEEEI
ncbi:MAG: O-antigen ligase family protein [Candidatus Omnitrophica bacterium]|nr:O-antigen ligase family protein [Candidatus Omnitrophota bacterium]